MGSGPHTRAWKWYVCGLLLLATLLNYMDRQTLAQLATDIKSDFQGRGVVFRDVDYGYLELGFGLAFALGSVVSGLLVDRAGVRWTYPAVLLGWSAAGFATAWTDGFAGLLVCRSLLGFFEAGQWPCALSASQRLLSRRDRALGNGILQSGAALGAVLTPVVIQLLPHDNPASWRGPFQVIGVLGLTWPLAWLGLVRRGDLPVAAASGPGAAATAPGGDGGPLASSATAFVRRLLVLIVVVVTINLCWHYFRAWLPKFLRESHHYGRTAVNYFTMAYYLATDLGSLGAGFASRWLSLRGWRVHSARLVLFAGCALLTALSTAAAWLPAGGLLLASLLAIGFGALGLFPLFYAFSQELTERHQGKLIGLLGCITWVASAVMHPLVGERIDATGSYATGLCLAGLMPLIGLFALLLFWDRQHQNA